MDCKDYNDAGYEKFTEFSNNKYTSTCKGCGRKHSVFTQSDCCPEYHTEVYVECLCGEKVGIRIPVN